MTIVRWILASSLVLFGGGFVLLAVLGGNFRRSFGGSDTNPLLIALPILVGGVLLGSIVFPGSKPLLHVAAAGAVALLGMCVWYMATEAATILWTVLAYLGLWFWFYW